MVAVSHWACIAAPRVSGVVAEAALACAALTASISVRRPRSNPSRSASVNVTWREVPCPAGAATVAVSPDESLPPQALPSSATVSARAIHLLVTNARSLRLVTAHPFYPPTGTLAQNDNRAGFV